MPQMNAGFLYVLINASMPGVVKVGKTERDPESRAKELSGVTGVPSPFAVVYQEFFDDCSAAEEFVHALLEESGYRVASNREFFSAPARVAIQALIQAKAALGGNEDGEPPLAAAVRSESAANPDSEPWEGILAQADDARYGSGDALQDLSEAARLYQQAARLGSAQACLELATLYLDGDFPDANEDIAITWLKEGGRRGNAVCYGRLAGVYLERGHTENAAKCWKRFREGSEGNEDFELWAVCYDYLATVTAKKINIEDIEDFSWFHEHSNQILRWGEGVLERNRKLGRRTDFFEARLWLIRYLIDPGTPLLRSKGFVKWWNEEDGGAGFVTMASGRDAFLTADQIVEGDLPPTVGQSADFVLVEGEKGPLACATRLFRGSSLCEGTRILSREEVSEVAAGMGLSSEQLLEAKAYPLSDKDWRSMVMMPASYFPRAWKHWEEKGDAAQMMKIAAVLARVIDGQPHPEI
jgi:cold shock CspA family protein